MTVQIKRLNLKGGRGGGGSSHTKKKKIKFGQDSGFLEKLTVQMFESGPTDGTTKNSRVGLNLNA